MSDTIQITQDDALRLRAMLELLSAETEPKTRTRLLQELNRAQLVPPGHWSSAAAVFRPTRACTTPE